MPAPVEMTARTTGRPATIDADAVARIAMELFSSNGYENTSMEDIAQAAGIGRKSLYRYFATKADLVWGGTEPVIEASMLAMDSATGGPVPPGDALAGLRDAVIAGAAVLPDLAVTRARLRLIAEHRELLSRSYESLGAQRQQALTYLMSAGIAADTARYLCTAFIGVTFEAWLQWAASTDPDPAPYLAAGTAVLRLPDEPQ
jgi:AcrR family transcriptional regulator